jgi:hypothetical protein
MSLFALVLNGTICQISEAMFPVASPLSWTTDISAVSPTPQFGWLATQSGASWSFAAPFSPPSPPMTLAQQAAAAYNAYISNGLTITSTGTPSLNGVYALDPTTQSDIADEAQFITTFSEFTNGGTTELQWPLQNGIPVSFPSTTEFLALAKVTAQSVAAAKLAASQIANGVSGVSMPSSSPPPIP